MKDINSTTTNSNDFYLGILDKLTENSSIEVEVNPKHRKGNNKLLKALDDAREHLLLKRKKTNIVFTVVRTRDIYSNNKRNKTVRVRRNMDAHRVLAYKITRLQDAA